MASGTEIQSILAGPLLNPPKEPPAWAVGIIDALSWAFPVAAAGLSVWGGAEALNRADDWAAALGIVGGVSAALGVLFTGWSSRIRDGRLAVAYAVASLGVDLASSAQSRSATLF
jgi:hypothetical protein